MRFPLALQAFSAVLQGTCTENGPSCNRGIALLEGEVLTGDGVTSCFAPFSKVVDTLLGCFDITDFKSLLIFFQVETSS